VYRENGKCIVDTNTEEDDGIYFEINHEKISLDYLIKLWADHDSRVAIFCGITGKKKNYGMQRGTPEKSCETCGHNNNEELNKRGGLEICEVCGNGKSEWRSISAPPSYLRKSSMCDWHHDSIQRFGALFDEFEKKHANSDQAIDKRLSELETFHRNMKGMICNCPVNTLGDFDKRIQECEERTRVYPLRNRLQLKIEELKQKVKALEDQHRIPFPDPEKYELVDLGVHGKIYIRKVK
jgi:hypothetical protein